MPSIGCDVGGWRYGVAVTLADVTRDSVLKAIGECDELGQEQFLAKHGFAPARLYKIQYEEREYDSKAIVGVAHGYATGKILGAAHFSGGQATVVRTLEALGFAFASTQKSNTAPRRAWLVMTKTEYRRLGGGEKYDDDAASHYSWDSNVANSRQVSPGDVIVVWDQADLIGASVIERIDHGEKNKPIGRCPECATTNYLERKTIQPRFRCYDCGHEFPNPTFTDSTVKTFRTTHDQGWVDLAGALDAKQLRALCVKSYSQNSIRELRWEDFTAAIKGATPGEPLTIVEATSTQLAGGHTTRPVRVRLGQPAFRAELLRRYGANCAFTGPSPEVALEACHLYSYAEIGVHDDEGGLLLRRDLHRLFDHGLIAVNELGTVDVAEEIRKYPLYDSLHGASLTVPMTKKQTVWLQRHWQEWRAPA